MSNTLSRSLGTLPAWIVQTVVGLILTSMVAWASWSTTSAQNHDTRIAVVEARTNATREDINEIKQTLIRMDGKLDRVLGGTNGK